MQTTVTRHNYRRLAEVAEIAAEVRSRMWSLFFVVAGGCLSSGNDLNAEEYEQVFEFLYSISKVAPFDVKTAEAMHFRRYVSLRLKAEHRYNERPEAAQRVIWRTAGVSDAKGFVFISHTGEIYPSCFLPVSAGNVRHDSLVDAYRNSGLFTILRDTGARQGKCGRCEFVKVCGGSRARAYATTGNFLAEDPRCCYQPQMHLEPAEVVAV
jgi:radical SAM protein with 4Fe4S-binding SPASM domain